ncbi:cytochrome c biogenesis CcdA family protein [Methanochimaera problematica]|nr:cytochrome c biogenesis protein CcdA [Methanoplanus sp. FWC-SCC4]
MLLALNVNAGNLIQTENTALNSGLTPNNSNYSYNNFTTFSQSRLDTSNTSINVFYNQHCSACHKAIPIIKEISSKYPNISVYYYDTYNSPNNQELLYLFGEKYGKKYLSYPAVLTGDTVIIEGFFNIDSNYEDVISSLDAGKIPDSEYEKKWAEVKTSENTSVKDDSDNLTIPLVLSAGLADGINPCAFAVLVILLIGLSTVESRKKMLITGFTYTLAVFLFYLLAGLGIITFIQSAGLSYAFSIVAGIIAIIAGFINITDGIFKGRGISIKIPESQKTTISRFIKKATIPAAFILGILVGIFELPCTGGIYLAILGLLSSEMTVYEGIPYLVLYNLMFVLPLIIITLISCTGLPPERINSFREEYRYIIRIFIGIIFFATGAIVIWWQL